MSTEHEKFYEGHWFEPRIPNKFGHQTINLEDHYGAIHIFGTREKAEERAAYIVLSANSHDELVAALDDLDTTARAISNLHHAGLTIDGELWSDLYDHTNKARTALKNAGGK